MMYLSDAQIHEMAQEILDNLQVSHLSHRRKMEIAEEHALENFGAAPRKSAVLMAVKVANAGWIGIGQECKRLIAEREARGWK